MRRRLEFRVADELPPKKDGANSMWNKGVEVHRLAEMRREAYRAMEGGPPLVRDIHLRLEIHVGPSEVGRVGDLDNFVTGVCDGLMAAHARASLSERWNLEPPEIHPLQCIAIADDREVLSIEARKTGDSATRWYRVVLEGET